MFLWALYMWLYEDSHGLSSTRIHLPFSNGFK